MAKVDQALESSFSCRNPPKNNDGSFGLHQGQVQIGVC